MTVIIADTSRTVSPELKRVLNGLVTICLSADLEYGLGILNMWIGLREPD